MQLQGLLGTPERIRIPDLLVRSQTLYPAELPALVRHYIVTLVNISIPRAKRQGIFHLVVHLVGLRLCDFVPELKATGTVAPTIARTVFLSLHPDRQVIVDGRPYIRACCMNQHMPELPKIYLSAQFPAPANMLPMPVAYTLPAGRRYRPPHRRKPLIALKLSFLGTRSSLSHSVTVCLCRA